MQQQPILSQMEAIWQEKGWNTEDLNSFRMEWVPGSSGPESGTGAPAEGNNSGNEGNQQQQGTTQQQQQGNQPEAVDWGANDFLKNVAETDRDAVGRYLKMIDSGISRRFQETHEKYKPYQDLGDVESLQQAMAISQMLEDNPKAIYDALAEALKDELGNSQGQGNQQENLLNGLENPELQGIPPEFAQKFEQQQQLLSAVAEFIVGQQQTQQESQEDQQLTEAIDSLKAEFGEFDEDYVLAKAYANGGDLVAAVKSYQETLQKATNGLGQMRQLPPILGGGGVVPQENSQSVKDLSRSQTQDLVANLLAAAQQT